MYRFVTTMDPADTALPALVRCVNKNLHRDKRPPLQRPQPHTASMADDI